MKQLIKISQQECIIIAGGRSEEIANLVESIAMCIGAFARLLYLVSRKSRQNIALQASDRVFPKW